MKITNVTRRSLGALISILAVMLLPAHGARSPIFEEFRRGSILEGKRVSVAIIDQKDGDPCLLDVRGRSNLLPPFLTPGDKSSALLNNTQLRICDREEELALEASVEHFSYNPEGVQMAMIPPVLFGSSMAFQCVLGSFVGAGIDVDDITFVNVAPVASGIALSVTFGFGSIFGVIAGVAFGLGSIATWVGCGRVTYLLFNDKSEQ